MMPCCSSKMARRMPSLCYHHYGTIGILFLLWCGLAFTAVAAFSMNYQRLDTATRVTTPRHCHHHQSCTLQMRLNPTSFQGTRYTITEFPRPALRHLPNVNITKFVDDDAEFAQTCREMMSIMYEAVGVGLAAPQIGLNRNMFVYNPTGDAKDGQHMERIVCNPTISQYSPDVVVEEEACLSLRSDAAAGQVARAAWIAVEYQNELGQVVRRRLSGFEARVFQHEYDHLHGILCYDRFPPEDRQAVQDTINELLGLYTAAAEEDANAAAIDPPIDISTLLPPPLTARYMPPLNDNDTDDTKKKKNKNKPSTKKSGFGGATKTTKAKKKK